MSLGILGKKIGMTQIYDTDGNVIPVSVIEAGPCTIVQKKSVEKDGYTALKVAFGNERKEKNATKAHKGIFAKLNLPVKSMFREFRIADHSSYQVGQEIKVDLFKAGDYVDVTGTTRGHGFQGTVKRHNFGGGPKSHGQSDRLRAPGAIGSNTYPARVYKGKRMAGHMGCDTVTIQKLEVVMVDPEKNLMLLKGSVPGPEKSIVTINQTVKSKKFKPQKVKQESKADKKAAAKKPAQAGAKEAKGSK